MKNLKFFLMASLCLFTSLCSNAQSDSANNQYNSKISYIQNMDNIFANVSKQYITTGIFYNRVMPLANLHNLKNGGIVSPALFWQAYYELSQASLNKDGQQGITKLKLLNAYYKQQGILSIGIINSNFTMFKDSLNESDSMIVNKGGLFYDGPNISKAWQTKTACFATLLSPKIEAGKKYEISIGDIMLENNNKKIEDVEIILKKTRGDGSIKLHAKGTFIIYNAGVYDAQIRIKMVGGEVLEYWQEIEVEGGESQRLQSQLNGVNCGIRPYNASPPNITSLDGLLQANIPFNGIAGQALVNVYFRTNGSNTSSPCPTNISKPIILLDGIDNEESHDAAWIYANKLIYRNPNQTNTTDTFRQIGDSLRMMGYDLVIFNPSIQQLPGIDTIDGGDDFIERNAMTLVQLIQFLKNDMTVQGINPEIVICGPSMGGQVSRYALAFMEQQFTNTNNQIWKHRCKLWASLDSPHEGANIPIGLQQYIKSLASLGSAAAVGLYEGNLCAPASRQQLIHQTDHNVNTTVDNILFNNTATERIGWMNTLAAFGYPNSCRKIALSNGTSLGGYFHTPGSNMLGLQVGNTNLLDVSFLSKFLPTTGNTTTTFFADINFLDDISVSYFPNWYTPIQINPVIHNNVLANASLTNTSIFGAIDACPGSFYNVQKEITDGIISGALSGIAGGVTQLNNTITNTINNSLNAISQAIGLGNFFNVSFFSGNQLANITTAAQMFAMSQISFPSATKNISFIPTVSSLGVINHNFNWALPLANNLVCNNLIPFDNYYVPKQNEEHVSFTQESWRWLKEELQKGHQGTDCISLCGVNQINGKDFLCRSTSSLYTLNASIITGASSGVVTTWTCSPGFTVVPTLGNVNQSATVTASSTANNGWVKAIISNPCGSEKTEIIKVINSGAVSTFTLSFKKVCLGCCEYEAKVGNLNSNALLASKFQWSIDGLNYTSITSPYFNLPNYGSYIGGINNLPANSPTVYVKNTQPCGTNIVLLSSTFTVATPPPFGCSWKKDPVITSTEFKGQEVSAFPNPTKNVWNIEIPNYANKQIKMSLYDMAGKEILRKEFYNLDSGIIELSAKDYLPNVYLLKVLIDDRVFHIKLLKE